MGYVSLRAQSTFSICQAFGMPEQIVEQAKKLGHKAVSLTEGGNTSSHPKLEVACRKHGLKPIYGVVLNVTERHEDKERHKDNVVVLAKNLEGYKNMLKLTNMSYKKDHFYYVPTVEYRELYEHQENLVVLTGSSLSGEFNEAEKRLQEMLDNIDDLYVEIDVSKDQLDNRQIMAVARMFDVPLVSTNDVQFIHDGQEEIVRFLTSVKSKFGRTPSKRSKIATREEMLSWGATEQALDNTVEIFNIIEDFDLPKAEQIRFEGKGDPYEVLLQECREGWVTRGIPKDKAEEYKARLFRELNLIRDKDYVDYFLVVSDLVRWAKEQNILVGPARGSAAGSLVSYLIGITEVDPIRWNLLFERFIDVSRHDPPDIDIDFQDDRRDEVKEYLEEKYGFEHVSNIAGYSLFRAKSLLGDIGRVHKIPRSRVEKAKNDLRESGGSMTIQEVIDHHFPEHSQLGQVNGMIRHLTVHAAGAVVASQKLEEFTTVGRDGLMLDKRDTEYVGLMKIDVLSLTTLTIISKCLEAIGETPEWLYNKIPLNDEKTYKAFQGEHFQGIFQYEGGATKRVCQQVAPSTFDELIDINALSRPGPLTSGATEAYINNERDDIHPVVTQHTERSRGQILFQEQIMSILREAGNLDWGDVTTVRKLITSSEGADKLEGVHQRFVDNFDDKEMGQEIWRRIGESGSYGFNVAHSTSYTFLGYYCMYLKVHYPLEFYWANMVAEPDNQSILLEYIQQGGKVYGVKHGRSQASWSIDRGGLRAGYLTIKGIGPKTAEKLLSGEEPKGRARNLLNEVEAFDEEDNEVDYLGVQEVSSKLEGIFGRSDIGEVNLGEHVRIGGRVTRIRHMDLKAVVEGQGRDYESEVDKPHLRKYCHLELTDETGTINATVNRFRYNNSDVEEQVNKVVEGESVVVITGRYSEKYRKVYVNRIEVLD